MPTTDEHQQIMRALKRRLALALSAPPGRFGSELAAYLSYIASNAELRALLAGGLAAEAQVVGARNAVSAVATQEYATRSQTTARVLAQWLQPWLSDGTLPEWFGPLLARCGDDASPEGLERSRKRWNALRETLVVSGLYTGEVVRLLQDVDSGEARWLALRANDQHRAASELTGTLARLWGHVCHGAPFLALPEWSAACADAAERAWEQSSMALLRQELVTDGGGPAALHAALCHDLRRLTAALVEALEVEVELGIARRKVGDAVVARLVAIELHGSLAAVLLLAEPRAIATAAYRERGYRQHPNHREVSNGHGSFPGWVRVRY